MADSTVPSLTDGGSLQATDIAYVARPDGAGGYLDRKVVIGAEFTAKAVAAAASAAAAAVSETNAAASAASAAAANLFGPSPNTWTGTTGTLALTDANTLVDLTNASGCNVTIPANASVAFPVGTQIVACQNNSASAQCQFTAAGGVTLQSKYGRTKFENTQYATVYLLKIATNTWRLSGDLSA